MLIFLKNRLHNRELLTNKRISKWSVKKNIKSYLLPLRFNWKELAKMVLKLCNDLELQSQSEAKELHSHMKDNIAT